jgi:hypothetical protein
MVDAGAQAPDSAGWSTPGPTPRTALRAVWSRGIRGLGPHGEKESVASATDEAPALAAAVTAGAQAPDSAGYPPPGPTPRTALRAVWSRGIPGLGPHAEKESVASAADEAPALAAAVTAGAQAPDSSGWSTPGLKPRTPLDGQRLGHAPDGSARRLVKRNPRPRPPRREGVRGFSRGRGAGTGRSGYGRGSSPGLLWVVNAGAQAPDSAGWSTPGPTPRTALRAVWSEESAASAPTERRSPWLQPRTRRRHWPQRLRPGLKPRTPLGIPRRGQRPGRLCAPSGQEESPASAPTQRRSPWLQPRTRRRHWPQRLRPGLKPRTPLGGRRRGSSPGLRWMVNAWATPRTALRAVWSRGIPGLGPHAEKESVASAADVAPALAAAVTAGAQAPDSSGWSTPGLKPRTPLGIPRRGQRPGRLCAPSGQEESPASAATERRSPWLQPRRVPADLGNPGLEMQQFVITKNPLSLLRRETPSARGVASRGVGITNS